MSRLGPTASPVLTPCPPEQISNVNPGYTPCNVLTATETARAGKAAGSALVMFLVLVALGSPLIYQGWQIREKYRALTDLPVLPSATVSDGELVKLSGRLKDTGENITSPVQSAQCKLAFWKMGVLRRYDSFNGRSYWSVAGIGIDAETLVVAGETRDIRISDVSRENALSATDELKHLLGSIENSALDSIARALDPPEFEDRLTPSEEWPGGYDELGARVGFEAETSEQPGLLGRLLNAIRTPEGTVQFQETTVSAGETVTVVGRVSGTENERVRLQGTESIDPVITRASPSELDSRYRRAYLIQLYGIPLLITALCSLAGVGAFLNP